MVHASLQVFLSTALMWVLETTKTCVVRHFYSEIVFSILVVVLYVCFDAYCKWLYCPCYILPGIWTIGSGQILNLEQLKNKVLVLVSGFNLSDMMR